MNKTLKNLTLFVGLFAGINNGILSAKTDLIPNIELQENSSHFLAINGMEKAKEFYEEGEFDSAINILKNAIDTYAKEGDILRQSQGLINLSLIYLKQGNWQETEKNINQVFPLIKNISNLEYQNKLTNFALEIQGELQLSIDQPEIALNTWQKSSNLAYERGDIQQFIYAKIKEIQALQEMGMYGKAVENLTTIQSKLETAPNDVITAKAWQTVGDFLIKFGEIESSKNALDKALNIAQQYNHDELVSDIIISQGNLALKEYQNSILTAKNKIIEIQPLLLNNRGNLTQFNLRDLNNSLQENRQIIEEYVQQVTNIYEQAFKASDNPEVQIIAQLAQLNLFVNYNQDKLPNFLIDNITDKINNLPVQKSSIHNRINFANNLIKLNNIKYNNLIVQQLTKAKTESDVLNYERGKSSALGSLGTVYAQSQRFSEAQTLTEKALFISQKINAPDLTYQWQWQLGKISKKQNKRKEAIIAYSSSVNTLQSLRSELVGVNSDLEFSFRNNVEPVYRELVDILLQPKDTVTVTPEEIKLARNIIESLQIAELDNYFQDACLDVKEVDLDKVADAQTAVFYPIILPDRIEVIVSLPNKPLLRETAYVPQQEIEKEIETLINNLQEVKDIDEIKLSLNHLYNYLIKPFVPNLTQERIKNLVFVSDGFLKSVPMSALYDGNKYLIENYNLAIAPSLKLVEPKSLTGKQLDVLLVGLSHMNPENARAKELNDLPGVETEIDSIEKLIPESTILLNETFTKDKLEETIHTSAFPVIHIATHGEFSSTVDNTFLLTWDGEIKINDLTQLFNQYSKQKEPVELLVLSACKTAVGDKRATLGLAGIALKAGARSTIASLWYVSDASTNLLMDNFYTQLATNSSSKAEALRLAQINLIHNSEFSHPYYWSAFILIGNWL